MEKYYLWLIMALSEGEPEITRLLKDFGTPDEVYGAFRKNTALAGTELTAKAEKTDLESAEKMLAELEKQNIKVITIGSPDYPENLLRGNNPPCVLFAQGKTELLKKKLITMVGSRAVTDYTRGVIPTIIRDLGDEYAVVSSLSEGCDQLTCLNSLKFDVPFIEVMPCGLAQTYPAGSRSLRKFLLDNGGLLISECLPKTRSSQGVFLRRSRIIGGISKVTLVLQAGIHSGALATAEYSKAPIFVPPHDVFRNEYSGAVNAIRAGAKLYFGTPDIEAAFRRADAAEKNETVKTEDVFASTPEEKAAAKAKFRKTNAPVKQKKEPAPESVTTEEAPSSVTPQDTAESAGFESAEHYSVFCAVRANSSPIGTEELIGKTGLSAEKLAELLLDLEIDGKIDNVHNKYTVT